MKYLIHTIAALTLLIISLPAFAGTSLKDTIQARDNEWAAAFNAGNVVALTALYEEDAVLLAPGGPPIHGNAAIGETFSSFFGVFQNLRAFTDEVRPAGDDYAIEIGHVEFDQADEDGTLFSVTLNYVVNWHKGEDGVWRLAIDIFNEQNREPKSE